MSRGNREKGSPDRGRTDMVKGKAKEVAGDVTGNDRLRREGKAEQVAGKVKQKANEAIDKAEDALSDEE